MKPGLADHETPYTSILDELDHIVPEKEFLVRKIICVKIPMEYFLKLIESSFIFFVHAILLK
ncbi:MAG: hypothetical protein Q8J68_04895 [Methanolobus sp.]|uniref:hypothetical protein n=1 Tax=Methanolobus sp. TaxID=1874737 RepID=UPI00272EEE08|nr:hypothetical protein [Methanolobus sp.]MDP2216605.1 hypothetical protein [Methanolobus sp.]